MKDEREKVVRAMRMNNGMRRDGDLGNHGTESGLKIDRRVRAVDGNPASVVLDFPMPSARDQEEWNTAPFQI